LFGEGGFALEGQGDVGERAEGDQFEAGIGANGVDDGVNGVRGFGTAFCGDVTMIAEAVRAVEPSRQD